MDCRCSWGWLTPKTAPRRAALACSHPAQPPAVPPSTSPTGCTSNAARVAAVPQTRPSLPNSAARPPNRTGHPLPPPAHLDLLVLGGHAALALLGHQARQPSATRQYGAACGGRERAAGERALCGQQRILECVRRLPRVAAWRGRPRPAAMLPATMKACPRWPKLLRRHRDRGRRAFPSTLTLPSAGARRSTCALGRAMLAMPLVVATFELAIVPDFEEEPCVTLFFSITTGEPFPHTNDVARPTIAIKKPCPTSIPCLVPIVESASCSRFCGRAAADPSFLVGLPEPTKPTPTPIGVLSSLLGSDPQS